MNLGDVSTANLELLVSSKSVSVPPVLTVANTCHIPNEVSYLIPTITPLPPTPLSYFENNIDSLLSEFPPK